MRTAAGLPGQGNDTLDVAVAVEALQLEQGMSGTGWMPGCGLVQDGRVASCGRGAAGVSDRLSQSVKL